MNDSKIQGHRLSVFSLGSKTKKCESLRVTDTLYLLTFMLHMKIWRCICTENFLFFSTRMLAHALLLCKPILQTPWISNAKCSKKHHTILYQNFLHSKYPIYSRGHFLMSVWPIWSSCQVCSKISFFYFFSVFSHWHLTFHLFAK